MTEPYYGSAARLAAAEATVALERALLASRENGADSWGTCTRGDVTEPYYSDATVTLYAGDCIDVLRELPDASVDAVVTDPPYGLEFMGKEWDRFKGANDWAKSGDTKEWTHRPNGGTDPFNSRDRPRYTAGHPFQAWCKLWAAECLRVLRPGGHLLAFGGSRTSHRLACAVEDAGFEIRDSIAWLYGSGFPKSLDVSKAIDRAAGATREVVGSGQYASRGRRTDNRVYGEATPSEHEVVTAPATDDARTWQGWGTALKPAHENIVVARKPFPGTVAGNVLAHGTGALNVDGCRVEGAKPDTTRGASVNASSMAGGPLGGQGRILDDGRGRWPPNVCMDESQAAALDAMSGELGFSAATIRNHAARHEQVAKGAEAERTTVGGHGDSGGASRFFYTAKAGAAERIRLGGDDKQANLRNPRCAKCQRVRLDYEKSRCQCSEPEWLPVEPGTISHPTVKPLSLMRWLVRLVTPPGGVVLEPFAGSGTTVEACILEGFRCIAIEREADYLPLITQRIHRRRDPAAYVAASGDDGGLFALLDEETP